ncbi:hypothetical protein Q3H58_002095 [Pseudomonas psychrotolerans]|nr:hypothetical protein [Pseudomonas psychrotolerans]
MVKKPLVVAVSAACLNLSLIAASHAAGFVEDSKATLSLRNFYYNNDNRNEASYAARNPSKVEEWGQGFLLNYQSGFTQGTVGFGVDAVGMLGLRLDGSGHAGRSTPIPTSRAPCSRVIRTTAPCTSSPALAPPPR